MRLGGWTAAFVAGMGLLIAAAMIVGYLIFRELHVMNAPQEDPAWTIFQLGYEHQRLLLAVETDADLQELKLRGDLYLSRVNLLRDAPIMEPLRNSSMSANVLGLLKSAGRTQQLLADVEKPGGREALRQEVVADSRAVRELMFDMSMLNRNIETEAVNRRARSLLAYLALLEFLVLVLLGLSGLVLGIARKLKKTGKELSAQFATQEDILRSADVAILGLDEEGRVLYSNPRALKLLGPSGARGALLPVSDAEHPLVAEVEAIIARPNEQPGDGISALRRAHVRKPDGTRHYRIRRNNAAASPGGRASLVISIADVTAEEEAAQRREEYDARIVEASRLLAYAAISGGIVHEISQPLAAIRNYIYALKVSLNLRQGSEEHRAIVEHLGVEVDRAIEVVRNVRLMGPQSPDDTGVCEVGEAIAHSVRLVTLGANPPPPIVIRDTKEATFVNGSLPLVGQVIVNLLKNAVSASAAAGRPGAEITVTADGERAVIAVADFGSGVSPDAAKSMFTPFTKSARGGMGLGLSICQRIASTLGGTLSWENRKEAGAVFKFTVPIAKEGITS